MTKKNYPSFKRHWCLLMSCTIFLLRNSVPIPSQLRNPTPKFHTKFWPKNPESHSEILHPSPQPHSEIPCQISSWNSDISLQNSNLFYQVHFCSVLTFPTTFLPVLLDFHTAWLFTCLGACYYFSYHSFQLTRWSCHNLFHYVLPDTFSTPICHLLSPTPFPLL